MELEKAPCEARFSATACKRHNPAAGATQGYDRLHAKRYSNAVTVLDITKVSKKQE